MTLASAHLVTPPAAKSVRVAEWLGIAPSALPEVRRARARIRVSRTTLTKREVQ